MGGRRGEGGNLIPVSASQRRELNEYIRDVRVKGLESEERVAAIKALRDCEVREDVDELLYIVHHDGRKRQYVMCACKAKERGERRRAQGRPSTAEQQEAARAREEKERVLKEAAAQEARQNAEANLECIKAIDGVAVGMKFKHAAVSVARRHLQTASSECERGAILEALLARQSSQEIKSAATAGSPFMELDVARLRGSFHARRLCTGASFRNLWRI